MLSACIKKDIRLITGGPVRSLLLLLFPAMLVVMMFLGMRDLAETRQYIKPFAIAVRDDDDSMMSRMLLSQLNDVGIFSATIVAGDKSDPQLFDMGCAAVVTFPKDFFYDLYSMSDTDLLITLNGDMSTEASIVRTVFSSVLDIITENQRVCYAAARIQYGELDDSAKAQLYYSYSNTALEDALGRLSLSDMTEMYSDKIDNTKLFFLAGVASMLCMFIPLCVLKTLPDEIEMGVFPRYAAAGGSVWKMLFSKLIAAFVMTALPVGILLCVLCSDGILLSIFVVLSVFLASFTLFLLLSWIVSGASRSLLLGSVLLLLMLVIGGALYPYELLPEFLQTFSRFTLPYYMLAGVNAAVRGSSFSDIVTLLCPLYIFIVVSASASFLLIGKRRRV